MRRCVCVVWIGKHPQLSSQILELPEVCATGNTIRAEQPADVHAASHPPFASPTSSLTSSRRPPPRPSAGAAARLFLRARRNVPRLARAGRGVRPGRDRAEIAPRSRRDRAEIAPRPRRDRARAGRGERLALLAHAPRGRVRLPPNPNHRTQVLMSYISGSVPEPVVGALYANAYKARQSSGSGWWWWCVGWWLSRAPYRHAGAQAGRAAAGARDPAETQPRSSRDPAEI